jgi:integrase
MRIAAFHGMCLEETCQLTLDDIREVSVNGGALWCIDIHNGDEDHHLKNEGARPRLLPIHSALVRFGLFEYIANVRKEGHPNKQLFPGLTRRPSKDNKIGARVGEIFNDKRRELGIKHEGKKLDFHSFRHNVGNRLRKMLVTEEDRARVLGHTVEGMPANYSAEGPELVDVKVLVEKIAYEGLRL